MAGKAKDKAVREYLQRMLMVMVGYILTVFGTTKFVRHHPMSGAKVFLFAALPTLPVIALLFVVAKYLRSEPDEYKRSITIQSMLIATAVVLALATFQDFLRSYGYPNGLPPFTLFCAFWFTMGLAEGLRTLMDRRASHEK